MPIKSYGGKILGGGGGRAALVTEELTQHALYLYL